MPRQAINPNVRDLDVPPIPRIQRAAGLYTSQVHDVVDLSQAVPGYAPPEKLCQALSRVAGDPACLGYGPIEGEHRFREAYASDVMRSHGGQLDVEQIQITAGCNQAFVTAAMTVASPGDAILLVSPWYFNHQSTLAMFGIQTRHVSVSADQGFLPELQQVEDAIDDQIRALAIVSPNNPTGAVYPPELIHALHALCNRRGIWLILDETYQDFLPPEHGPAHELFSRGPADHFISLSSFSKSYCIPGHRLGVVIASSGLIEQIGKVMDNLQICAPRTGQLALADCLSGLVDWRAANRHRIQRRAEALKHVMQELPEWQLESIGAYFAYVQHPWPEQDSVSVAERLARELGIVTLPGAFFGPGQDRYLRLAFANVSSDVIATLPARFSTSAEAPRRPSPNGP